MKILKHSGDLSLFSEEKLKRSLQNSGVKVDQLNQVLSNIEKGLYEGISTRKLYRLTSRQLSKHSLNAAYIYNLKAAIRQLGPGDLPFKLFTSQLLQAEGFETLTGVIVRGKCITHELGMIAEKNNQHFVVECKFLDRPGNKADEKTLLFTRSRFTDVEYSWRNIAGKRDKFHQGWVITNGKFTSNAIAYGNCIGLHLIGWDFPFEGSLKNLIIKNGLYPITSLNTLSKFEKRDLINTGTVSCKTLVKHPDILDHSTLKGIKKKKVLNEVFDLYSDPVLRAMADS